MAMLNRFSRILVVDDSATTRSAIKLMFQRLGHVNVDEAADGSEALSKLKESHYALVVSDWFMEPMSGLELLLKLRRSERWSNLPFIMITAQSQKKFMDVARDAGATHYLAKPFGIAELGAKIGNLKNQTKIDPTRPIVASHRRSA
jgi:two-component system chemotaxis response regulator CheY